MKPKQKENIKETISKAQLQYCKASLDYFYQQWCSIQEMLTRCEFFQQYKQKTAGSDEDVCSDEILQLHHEVWSKFNDTAQFCIAFLKIKRTNKKVEIDKAYRTLIKEFAKQGVE